MKNRELKIFDNNKRTIKRNYSQIILDILMTIKKTERVGMSRTRLGEKANLSPQAKIFYFDKLFSFGLFLIPISLFILLLDFNGGTNK